MGGENCPLQEGSIIWLHSFGLLATHSGLSLGWPLAQADTHDVRSTVFNFLSGRRQFTVLDVRNRPQNRGVKLGKGGISC